MSAVYALRVISAAEFVAALALWGVALCPWQLSGAVATVSLVVFLLTYPEPSVP